MRSGISLSHLWKISILYYILFIAVLCLLIHKWRKRKMLKMLRNFYSKPTLPIIGNLYYITGNMKERVVKVLKLLPDMELPAVAWIFHIPLVLIGTPDNMNLVLNKTTDEIGLLRFFRKTFGQGIILSHGEKWRKSRRTISSAFSPSMMQHYLGVFNEYSEILIKKTASHTNTNMAFDIGDYIVHLNGDIIIRNMSGYELKSLENENNEVAEAVKKSAELNCMRISQPLLYFDCVYNIYLYLTGRGKVFEIIENLVTEIIQCRTEKLQRQQSKDENVGLKTLLDTLLKVHEVDSEFSKENVKDNLSNMIIAGAATTARTTSFLLLMFAMHQDIQEKAHQEIITIFGNNNLPIEMEDINRLVYLEQCIKETLRKYPAIPITFRKYAQDVQLNDKQTIPAHCHTLIGIYALHHNEQIYPNNEIWDPERFSPEAILERNRFAFLPFGLGPRMCIGAKYAMISMKTQMVYLIRNYRFTTDLKMEEIQLSFDANLRSDNGYWLKFWKRENNK